MRIGMVVKCEDGPYVWNEQCKNCLGFVKEDRKGGVFLVSMLSHSKQCSGTFYRKIFHNREINEIESKLTKLLYE